MDEIIVNENKNLKFVFDENKDVSLKILVKQEIECNLDVFINSNSKQNIEIELEKGAKLNHNCIILKTNKANCNVTQMKSSVYENLSVNFANKTNFTTNNSVSLNEEETYSNIKIVNIANNSSNIESSGLICIKKQAIRSVGHQKFEGILLDDNSSINAKPNLEVKNNDVICSHGASITQIADEKLFYLNSKGFNKEQSVNLIIHGYFDSVLLKMDKEFAKKIRKTLEENKVI